MWRADSLGKTLMLRKIEGRMRSGWQMVVGWHHQPSGHEFEQTWGDSEGQGDLAFCSPWSRKESDMTEQLNNNNFTEQTSTQVDFLSWLFLFVCFVFFFFAFPIRVYSWWHCTTEWAPQSGREGRRYGPGWPDCTWATTGRCTAPKRTCRREHTGQGAWRPQDKGMTSFCKWSRALARSACPDSPSFQTCTVRYGSHRPSSTQTWYM